MLPAARVCGRVVEQVERLVVVARAREHHAVRDRVRGGLERRVGEQLERAFAVAGGVGELAGAVRGAGREHEASRGEGTVIGFGADERAGALVLAAVERELGVEEIGEPGLGLDAGLAQQRDPVARGLEREPVERLAPGGGRGPRGEGAAVPSPSRNAVPAWPATISAGAPARSSALPSSPCSWRRRASSRLAYATSRSSG